MRGGAGRRLRSRALHLRREQIFDGQGGWSIEWVELEDRLQCLRRGVGSSGRDDVRADQQVIDADHVVYLLPEADVRHGDALVVDGYELAVGRTWSPSVERYRAAACLETQLEASA